ncbi:MAG: UPF0182 family protein [Gemmatimonadota bacterium]|nr:UPF0182 family protein [Gemmatimonadota bacterium]MDH3422099.1 UPF0182 family protein [Gemmatimonadota bacterium]
MSGTSGVPISLRGGRLILTIVLSVALIIAFGRAFAAFYTEVLWQTSSGYGGIFWKRVLWTGGVQLGAGAVVAILVVINLYVASKTLGGIQIRRRFGNIEINEQIPKRYVWWAMLGAAGLLGLWFGIGVPDDVGLSGLLLLSADAWGATEPILGRDIGFYVFTLPVLRIVSGLGLMITFLLFALVTAAYAATGALRWTDGRILAQDLPRIHLGALVATFLVLLAVQLSLARYLLLLDGSSPVQGIFGFTDAEARLPAFRTLSIISLVAAGGVLWGAWKNRPGTLAASLMGVVIGSIVIGQFYPGLIQRIRVEPNELVRETPYIEYNLDFTRRGFGLDEVDRRQFTYGPGESIDWAAIARQMAGLPVWNQSALLATYRELEALFPYYDFADVTIDRYRTPQGPVAVALSVRQIDPGGIQDPNWQNLHIRKRYVAGAGAVASLASVRSAEGRPQMLMTGIPPQVARDAAPVTGIDLTRPDIFFGTRQQRYAVVSPDIGEYAAPDGSPGVPGVDFPVGIELTSSPRRALLAWNFGDLNLLISPEITASSRFIYRRLAVERAIAVAPFLRYPEEPYPVVADGRIYWLLEGFTATSGFPLSTASDFGSVRRTVNYVRNSVKVTVDAVTGQVDFYRVPIEDPLADAYGQAFPGLFRPMDEMPEAIREHLRYPSSLISLQSRVLLQYHQETAPAFHGQQDVWNEPQELAQGPTPVPYRPEYGLYTLPGESEPRFHLTTVFVPAGRQNLTGMLIGRTGETGIPELILLDVPVEDQTPGPRQIEALVEQDPVISQQFSLWRTGGSEVWTGHLHLIPTGNRFVYMEPVFLAAEADAIPELRRFVVSDGRRVAMTEDLDAAIRQFAGQSLPAPMVDPAPAVEGEVPMPPGPRGEEWPAAALDLLERAESSAREGNWQGFGQALDELRLLLEQLEGDAS